MPGSPIVGPNGLSHTVEGWRLSPRETQIVSLVAEGLANRGIARRLHISEGTVAAHLRRVFAKLSVRSRAAMVYRFAVTRSASGDI